MKVNSVNNQSFGMNLKADESFWVNIRTQIWNNPSSKKTEKLIKQLEKIGGFPLNDTYEIKKVDNVIKKEIKNSPFKFFSNIIQEGYQLINKTKNEKVLESVSEDYLRKYYNPKIKPADFINTIAKNLKKLAKLEKLK